MGLPFEYGSVVGVGVKPLFGTLYDLPELLGLRGACQLGAALLLLDPEHRVDGIGIERRFGDVVLLDIGEAVDYGEELADVVGSHRCFVVEQLLTGVDVNPLIFHHSGVAAAGCIDGYGVEQRKFGEGNLGIYDGESREGVGHEYRRRCRRGGRGSGRRLLGRSGDIGLGKSLSGLGEGGVRTILGRLETLYLSFAVGPIGVYARYASLPDDVELRLAFSHPPVLAFAGFGGT